MMLVVKALENSTYCVFCFINEDCNKHIFPLFLLNLSIAYFTVFIFLFYYDMIQ